MDYNKCRFREGCTVSCLWLGTAFSLLPCEPPMNALQLFHECSTSGIMMEIYCKEYSEPGHDYLNIILRPKQRGGVWDVWVAPVKVQRSMLYFMKLCTPIGLYLFSLLAKLFQGLKCNLELHVNQHSTTHEAKIKTREYSNVRRWNQIFFFLRKLYKTMN